MTYQNTSKKKKQTNTTSDEEFSRNYKTKKRYIQELRAREAEEEIKEYGSKEIQEQLR